LRGGYLCGRERVNEDGKGIFSIYFLFRYQYGTLKPVKVILRREVGEEGE
jgi:hypothetical protein